MAVLITTTVRDGELDHTVSISYDTYAEAVKEAGYMAGPGVVGCIKVGDKIKKVF